jgi:hypothetical protein
MASSYEKQSTTVGSTPQKERNRRERGRVTKIKAKEGEAENEEKKRRAIFEKIPYLGYFRLPQKKSII